MKQYQIYNKKYMKKPNILCFIEERQSIIIWVKILKLSQNELRKLKSFLEQKANRNSLNENAPNVLD